MHCITAFILVAAGALSFLVGCATSQNGNTNEFYMVTMLELAGTEGAPVTGYYIVNGERVQVSGILSITIPDSSVRGGEFNEGNLHDTLTLAVHEGRSFLTATANPGTDGIKAARSVGGGMSRRSESELRTDSAANTHRRLASIAVRQTTK